MVKFHQHFYSIWLDLIKTFIKNCLIYIIVLDLLKKVIINQKSKVVGNGVNTYSIEAMGLSPHE